MWPFIPKSGGNQERTLQDQSALTHKTAAASPLPSHDTANTQCGDQKSDVVKRRSIQLVEVQPLHVVAASTAVVAAGAMATGMITYRSGAKSLAEDGINPDVRLKIIPVAFKTLMLSTMFTGVLGVAGFVALKSSGILTADRAELPAAVEAARLIRNPRAFISELLGAEQQKDQQSVDGEKG